MESEGLVGRRSAPFGSVNLAARSGEPSGSRVRSSTTGCRRPGRARLNSLTKAGYLSTVPSAPATFRLAGPSGPICQCEEGKFMRRTRMMVAAISAAAVSLLGVAAVPASAAQPDTGSCYRTSAGINSDATHIYGSAQFNCSSNWSGAITAQIQQYRGAGYWAAKATRSTGSSGTLVGVSVTWTCASGTGNQLYRTYGYAYNTKGYSSQYRVTCPA